ncbi:L-threonylcarbamoyladenylate synthase [Halalkalicoccus ordinarius]|uniref:L-threonylcarbamoyladenylate synthase n=1 Tax=Halalkalicoccus ordinarius TaxID=3116651 RepID=UPI00300F64D4
MNASDSDAELERAADAIRGGELVVYPTETVYGLGADALDPEAIDRVFEAKGRPRSNPLSMAVPDVESAVQYTDLTDRERRFVREFLPGPVTVVVEAGDRVPEALTAGRDRVGVRIPDHPLALSLLERVAPVTATSANRSGEPSARRADELDPEIREAVESVLDGGEVGGTESTVVDVENEEIHRRGALADRIEAWLEAEQ